MGAPVRRLHGEINDLARGASAASPCLVWMRSDPGSKPGTKSGRSGRHERRSGDVRIGVVAWQDGVRPYNAPRSVRGLRACGTCSESHCVAEDAVLIGPVSAPRFPANREINREFCRFHPSGVIFASIRLINSMACSEIPYATEQGILAR